ncbi:MAG: hypothetical protein KC912_07940 [Proteobacteria bacterium]|nr:hypothetical protein [Pseudomonadota bacterium]
MKSRLAAVAIAILVAIAAAALWLPNVLNREPAVPPIDAAWALLAPELTPKHCAAPAADAYSARDIHWLHATPTGISMASPKESGKNALLGMFEPIGTLTWDAEGCTVGPVETYTVSVQVVDAEDTPVEAIVASCPWTDIVTTTDGAATLELPVGARCKVVAYVIDGDDFQKSPAQPIGDHEAFKLTIDPKSMPISDQQAATKKVLDRIGKLLDRGPYTLTLQATEDPEILAVLEGWKAQYEARQDVAMTRMRTMAMEDDGWMRLSR